MENVLLGSKAAGSIVKLKENGVPVDYIVVHQGKPSNLYDDSCDGIWLLRNDILELRQWHSSNVNDYANSTIHSYLNSTILSLFDANIQAQIKQVKIPYCKGDGSTGTTQNGEYGLSCRIFLLSGPELHFFHTYMNAGEGTELSYFASCSIVNADSKRVAYLNGTASSWSLRSPMRTAASSVWSVLADGSYREVTCIAATGVRPALVLPADLSVSDDGTVLANTAPATPPAITIPAQINGGSTVTVEWGLSSDAEDNLEGYKVERSLDGGTTWTQIYQGGAVSTTNLVPFGTESVLYRVKAYDAGGLESGWKTSAQVTVINNTAPTVPAGIAVPEAVQGGQPLTVAWGPSTDGENNLAGYCLERQVDGGDWGAVYSGPELSFTDQITKGWQTVAYRVRAYDSASAYSGFAASGPWEVNNNTPPVIICEYPANASLGVKSEGFAVDYSVEDKEGDAVTVTEAVDGAALRMFQAGLGGSNSFRLDGEDFMRLLNGRHALNITAADSASKAVHSLSFEKLVDSASVTLERPMEADGPVSVCVLSVSGSIPLDAEYRVEATNNALDGEPVWEDCTAAVRAGANHVFENKDAANGYAFNFRLTVKRGESGTGGYITSVQGGFQ